MTAEAEAPINPLDTWRQFITDSERQWNSFFREVLGSDQASSSMNAWVEASLTVQRMVADQLERMYTAFNIPTHGDLVDLGERMKALEDHMSRIESLVQRAPAASRTAKSRRGRASTGRARPPRTKRPAGVAASANGGPR